MNKYCEIYDSYYTKDREWISKNCEDIKCKYCNSRPEKHPKSCKRCKKKKGKL